MDPTRFDEAVNGFVGQYLDEITDTLRSQIEAVVERLWSNWSRLAPEAAVPALEAQLARELPDWFGLTSAEAAEVLRRIPVQDPAQRRDALLWLAAFCIVLIANGLERDFLQKVTDGSE